ncbi:MAG: hypothetical protein VX569_10360 [Pseudomonadota bacterium]|jgi:uncharacterized protein YeeX (DUF496 family)|nr:hypothetical protein [Pseudomonadota bacterium]
MGKDEGRTLAEIMAELHADPVWVAREEQRERERQKLAEEYDRDVAPVVADLAKRGIYVRSLGEFINTSESYPEAIPVLLEHLQRDYPLRIRESIIRSLTVREARGEGARIMLAEFRNSGNEHHQIRWAMANAFDVIADAEMIPELEELAARERDDSVARMLEMAIKSAKKRKPA